MKILKGLSAISASIKGLSVISASVALILFIGHVWLCYASNGKRRYTGVLCPLTKDEI